LLVALTVAASTCSARPLLAAQPDERAVAEAQALFERGRELMDRGEIGQACRAFERSQGLAPAGGTLLNLALCHRKDNRLASARARFADALEVARRDRRDDRVREALEQLASLEAHVSRLTILGPPSVPPDLVILRDGAPLARAAWGVAALVDGGTYVVEARAAGKKPWRASLTVLAADDHRVVQVPALEPIQTAPVRAAEQPGPRPDRTWVYVAGAAAVVGVAVGSGFGVDAIRKRQEVEQRCPDLKRCAAGVELNEDAKRSADISTVAFGVGLSAAAIAAIQLWLIGPSPAGRPAAAVVTATPTPVRGGGLLGLSGHFD
jgi:hypothetical protein